MWVYVPSYLFQPELVMDWGQGSTEEEEERTQMQAEIQICKYTSEPLFWPMTGFDFQNLPIVHILFLESG